MITLEDLIKRNGLVYSTPVEKLNDLTVDEEFLYVYYHFFNFEDLLVVNKLQTTHLVPLCMFKTVHNGIYSFSRNLYHIDYSRHTIHPNFTSDLIFSIHVMCSNDEVTEFYQQRSCQLLDEYDIMCFDANVEILHL